ncbi:MAG: aspartyl protease family protein [Planctomycetota bacterium]
MNRTVAEMGEVRVDVRLTNLVDAELAARGDLPAESVRTVTRNALVDTGAISSALPQDVVEELGLRVQHTRPVELADGESQEVGVVYGVIFDLVDRDTEDQAFVIGNEVLIGQTVLEKLDLLVDCPNQRLIGNPEHPDGPVLKMK